MISRELLELILAGYRLPRMGTHGLPHWGRVLETGLRLSETTGANVRIVELFAVLHDCRRVNEVTDPGHGRRAAEFAAALPREILGLDDPSRELLLEACAGHTDGLLRADVTVQTCWDADRLDLARVGITPRPGKLCTLSARDPVVLRWAVDRGERGVVPDFVRDEWLART